MKNEYKGVDLGFGNVLSRGGGPGAPEHLHGLIDFCEDNVSSESTVLELGCYEGASTKVFAHFAKKVIAVDIAFNLVDKSSMPENVEFIRCSSLLLNELLEGKQIFYDVLYIDTVHTEDHCTKELNALHQYCKSDPKIIGGHDYNFPGVKNAVIKFFGKEPDKVYSEHSWVYHWENSKDV